MADEQAEELEAIQAIFPEFNLNEQRSGGDLELAVKPTKPLLVRFVPSAAPENATKDHRLAYIEHDIALSTLPPLVLSIQLPNDYPEHQAPRVSVTSRHKWLPASTRYDLEADASRMWEEYGHGQCLFAYIDQVQSRAETGFDLDSEGCLTLPQSFETALTEFERETKQAEFNKGTYECSVCLEPKKGIACYQLDGCGHVFCKRCLQDFYINAINEGDVAVVRCLDPDCAKDNPVKQPSLHPRELLLMDIAEPTVRRYVEMRRKKRLESDKTVVYCPRAWCQGPARSLRYPPIPQDLRQYVDPPDTVEEKKDKPLNNGVASAEEDERLAICEKCTFAFCRTCFASWHGSFVRCRPRDPSELTAEEKLSYDYIRQHTSPCPTCSSPTQKTMGCNHMHCFQCRTHFCYLCGAWLDGQNPYEHFNTPGRECYQRLWELEEGDDGQAPADGRGFAGARGVEALLVDDEQDHIPEQEAQQVFAAAVARPRAEARLPPRAQANRGGRGAARAGGPALRVQHDNAAGVAEEDDGNVRRGAGIRRFIELALLDQEEEWDSDELTDDDEAWQIR